jgi:hypothetical protein
VDPAPQEFQKLPTLGDLFKHHALAAHLGGFGEGDTSGKGRKICKVIRRSPLHHQRMMFVQSLSTGKISGANPALQMLLSR